MERPVIVFAPIPKREKAQVAAPERVRPIIRFGLPEEPGSGVVPQEEALGVDLWDLVRDRYQGYGRITVS